jgi:antitoxin CptB
MPGDNIASNVAPKTLTFGRSVAISASPGTSGLFVLDPLASDLMSGSAISSEGLDARRRRLLFRAWHRGMREVDLITGRFADAHIASLSETEVDDFERLMDVAEPDLLAWVMGSAAPPPDHDTALFRRMCAFHARGVA